LAFVIRRSGRASVGGLVSGPRSAGAALVILFLAAHLVWLPRTLEDLDSVNFALGVRDFDVAKHQPHPPGYPIYIALAKASTGALRLVGVEAAAPRGLAIWSAIGGALALPAVVLFFRRLEGRDAVAAWTALVVAVCPLYWFTSLRPLSDMLGFAVSMWVLALAAGAPSTRTLTGAALLAGLAIGIRTQTAVLTLPFLAYAVSARRSAAAIVGVVAAIAAGAIAWGVPLLVASGGVSSYLHALTFQAGADFGGVSMLWTHHTRRDVVKALLDTFVWPWDWRIGLVVCLLAAAGAARIASRSPRAVIALAVGFGPYAVFHLLFQETVTTRYAVPLVPLMAYAALAALEGLPARAMQGAAIGLAALSLAGTIPASARYAREGAPIFRAFDDMAATAHGGDRVDVIGMHAIAKRSAEWSAPILPARVVLATHGHEWLTLIDVWKTNPAARVWFAADPVRTDLALFDPHAREVARAYTWGFAELPFVGGARPNDVDWLHMQPPGWMLDKGWSLTAEVGGITARDRSGPALAAAVAWLKQRSETTTVVIGGRHIGAGTATAALRLNGSPLETFQVPPGFFMRVLTLPGGALGGDAPYQPLEVTSVGELSLEQFDAQPPGVPMFAYDRGWHEPEFNLSEARAWRWTSENSDLWVRPIGRPVTLRLLGENPLRYFDAPPHVRVLAGGREIAAFDPAGDFEQTITIPPDVLDAAGGKITLDTSKFFVPGGGGDQRHLALRVYRVSVE
jgi:hypothetical protein